MNIIVGLGNPGEKYKLTRHNAGFMAVDALAKKYETDWTRNKKFNAEMADIPGVILVKPLTFMNNSGLAVRALLSYYKLLPKVAFFRAAHSDLSDTLTVIHDDIDLELGRYKLSADSGSAGHKGVESIIRHLKTKNFRRLRLGIRTAYAGGIPTEKFVLQRFNKEEMNTIESIIREIPEIITL